MTASYTNEFSLIDLVLAEQRDMSAVERFSDFYERSARSETRYQHLIPLSRPGPGEQYAFVVDLDRCSGCKACVSACHSLNGLDESEMWRNVGTIVGDDSPYLQTVTSSCHHCVDPACAAGCPVLAYEKDPETGIVRHLDDQCIGCQYCVLKCPYDVPKYSRSKGIVRKCDMCHSRMADGEAPACAQACPHEAIRIEIVDQRAVEATANQSMARILPGAFPSSYTVPTTRYECERPVPEASKASIRPQKLEHAHWPLIIMLVLTQAALGLNLVASVLSVMSQQAPVATLNIAAGALLLTGLMASVFHLGRPLKAWRAFLGWRRSWMSREILAFSLYMPVALTVAAVFSNIALSLLTVAVGALAISCSAMIYIDTRREGWDNRAVFSSFFGTVALLGPTIAGAICVWSYPAVAPDLAIAATVVRTILFLSRRERPAAHLVPGTRLAAISLFTISTAFSLAAIFNLGGLAAYWGTAACLSTLAAQTLDRWLFFAATPAPRMPGAALV